MKTAPPQAEDIWPSPIIVCPACNWPTEGSVHAGDPHAFADCDNPDCDVVHFRRKVA